MIKSRITKAKRIGNEKIMVAIIMIQSIRTTLVVTLTTTATTAIMIIVIIITIIIMKIIIIIIIIMILLYIKSDSNIKTVKQNENE